MLEVTGELTCTGSQASCDSRLLCQSLFLVGTEFCMLKNEREEKKTDDDSHLFQYDMNTKWKMQKSLKIKERGDVGGKENS